MHSIPIRPAEHNRRPRRKPELFLSLPLENFRKTVCRGIRRVDSSDDQDMLLTRGRASPLGRFHRPSIPTPRHQQPAPYGIERIEGLAIPVSRHPKPATIRLADRSSYGTHQAESGERVLLNHRMNSPGRGPALPSFSGRSRRESTAREEKL